MCCSLSTIPELDIIGIIPTFHSCAILMVVGKQVLNFEYYDK